MAEMVNNITVNVKTKLTVDIETAETCMRLVNWFLEANEEYRLARGEGGWALTREWMAR